MHATHAKEDRPWEKKKASGRFKTNNIKNGEKYIWTKHTI